MNMIYLWALLFGWVVCGGIKFILNSIRLRKLAWKQIGYGGFPSTHTAVVSTVIFLVGLLEGFSSGAFGVGLIVLWVVIMDALTLRRHVGKHAEAINLLMKNQPNWGNLRERIGHNFIQIIGGVLVGMVCALLLKRLFSL